MYVLLWTDYHHQWVLGNVSIPCHHKIGSQQMVAPFLSFFSPSSFRTPMEFIGYTFNISYVNYKDRLCRRIIKSTRLTLKLILDSPSRLVLEFTGALPETRRYTHPIYCICTQWIGAFKVGIVPRGRRISPVNSRTSLLGESKINFNISLLDFITSQ